MNGLFKFWPIAVFVIGGAIAWGTLSAQVSSINNIVEDQETRMRTVEMTTIRTEALHRQIIDDLQALKMEVRTLIGRRP